MILEKFNEERFAEIPFARISVEALAEARRRFVEAFNSIPSIFVTTKVWADIVGDKELALVLDPSSKKSEVQEGKLGMISGMEITSDAFEHPEVKRRDLTLVLYNTELSVAMYFSFSLS